MVIATAAKKLRDRIVYWGPRPQLAQDMSCRRAYDPASAADWVEAHAGWVENDALALKLDVVESGVV
jgi:hypothetical protein